MEDPRSYVLSVPGNICPVLISGVPVSPVALASITPTARVFVPGLYVNPVSVLTSSLPVAVSTNVIKCSAFVVLVAVSFIVVASMLVRLLPSIPGGIVPSRFAADMFVRRLPFPENLVANSVPLLELNVKLVPDLGCRSPVGPPEAYITLQLLTVDSSVTLISVQAPVTSPVRLPTNPPVDVIIPVAFPVVSCNCPRVEIPVAA